MFKNFLNLASKQPAKNYNISQTHITRKLFQQNIFKFSNNIKYTPPGKDFQQRDLLNQFSHDLLLEDSFYTQIKENNPDKKFFSAYVGFDPTADSLHLGNLITIIAMIRLSYLGIKPILLVGGATGQIGDPSGKSVERQMLTKQEVQNNIDGISSTLTQVSKSIYSFLEKKYGIKPEHNFQIVNNYDHYKDLNMIDFIRDVGKYFRMGNLLAKETVSSRLNTEQGLSYTEFTYTLLQGYDFERLYLDHNCIIQLGGSDQWGNILSGFELIRKKHKKEVYCMTIPLLTTSSGQKFGKSEGNAIWIDLKRQDPNALYQYLFNQPDDMVIKLLKMFTFIPIEEIEQVEKEHLEFPEKRLAQKLLAETMVEMLSQDLNIKVSTTNHLQTIFKTNFEEFKLKDHNEIHEFFSDKESLIQKQSLEHVKSEIKSIQDLLVNFAGVKQSKKEIRRTIDKGGLYINGSRISLEDSKDFLANFDQFLMANQYMVIRMGKKNHFIFKFE